MDKKKIQMMLINFVDDAVYIKHSMHDDESDEVEIKDEPLERYTNKVLKIIEEDKETERKKSEKDLKDARNCILNSVTSESKCTLCQNKYCPLNEVNKQ